MNELRAQIGIAAEPTGGQERRSRADGALISGGRPDDGAHDRSVLEQEPLRGRAHQQLAVLAHQPLTRQQVIGHVGLAPAPVSEHRHGVRHVDAQRPYPVERLGIALDNPC